MKQPNYPLLYQINTRVYLHQIAADSGKSNATLDDIPDAFLDECKTMGFQWLWFLSVWKTGEKGRKVSLNHTEWKHEFEQTLPDLKKADIGGSGFAIAAYEVAENLGGNEALSRLRKRLHKRDMKLMLDFVPNHMGPDHPWVMEHPDYFIGGTTDDLMRAPQNFAQLTIKRKKQVLAYGRDPFFDGWPDTFQLDYSNPGTVAAMHSEILRVSRQCDGLRCDMAMLILPEVFEKTWGRQACSFWPEAIKAIKKNSKDFIFMAEVYWDMEWQMQQIGFDYTYDKRLYDRLVDGHATPVRGHLMADMEYQNKSARFLENHDEPRAAATFELAKHKAAAVITFLSPGLRFFHQGQLTGRLKRISPHLVRAPKEPENEELKAFYRSLLEILRMPALHTGQWQLIECRPAWEGNNSNEAFIAFSWQFSDERLIIVVNFAAHTSQTYLTLPHQGLNGASWRFEDSLGNACYDRDGDALASSGLYLDMEAWQFHAFEMKKST